MQKGNIGVTTENIFPVIKKFLYSDHEIFLREMVSNAVDATQKIKTLAERGDFSGELGDLTVRISLDADKGTLTFSDNGIGMDKDEIIAISRKIDTFETSIEPYEDCCTVFTPKHPKTKPRLDDVLKAEANMENLDEMMDRAVAGVKKVVIK